VAFNRGRCGFLDNSGINIMAFFCILVPVLCDDDDDDVNDDDDDDDNTVFIFINYTLQ